MPYIKNLRFINRVNPFIYDKNAVHFYDNFTNTNNWTITGSYEVTPDGLHISGDTRAISTNPIIQNKDFFAIATRVRFNSLQDGDKILLGFSNVNATTRVYVNVQYEYGYPTGAYKIGIYINEDKIAETSSIQTPDEFDLVLIKTKDIVNVCITIYDMLLPVVWAKIPQDIQTDCIAFGSYAGDFTYKYIGVYEASGITLFGFEYITDEKLKIYNDGEYFYAVSREAYGTFDEHNALVDYVSRLIILRTRDFINFEPYRHITLNTTKIVPLYAYFDGNNIYVWLYNEDSTYQNGLHRLFVAIFDTNFNLISLNENIIINNLNDGTIEGISFTKIHGEWYALGIYKSDSESKIALFTVSNPATSELNFVKFITDVDNSSKFISSDVVTDLNSNYVLVTIPFLEPIYQIPELSAILLDTSFNVIAEPIILENLGDVQYPETSYTLFMNNKFLYISDYMTGPEPNYSINVFNVDSDLYNLAYAPKETILGLIVTSNNITAKLLGKSDEDGYIPIPNATIHIYELQETTWNKIGDYITDSNGVVSIDRVNTQEWYKAVFDGTEEYRPATTYANLQTTPPQPPPEQPPQQQQTLQSFMCPSCLWLLLLFIASLFKRKEEQVEA